MLSQITLLTSILFAAIYPLCFWISVDEPLKDNFHKFHLGLPNVVGGIILVFVIISDLPLTIKYLVGFWQLAFFISALMEWKREFPRAWLISIPCILGLITFVAIHNTILNQGWQSAIMWILSGCIYCAALYAMNLGHWYLNVHGLPLKHLLRSTYLFWILLAIRLLWDLVYMFTQTTIYRGDIIPIWKFIGTLEGLLIGVGIFFGTLFPFGTLYFVKETILLKSTQSATGILYSILCALLLGDIAYKYFMIRYAIIL